MRSLPRSFYRCPDHSTRRWGERPALPDGALDGPPHAPLWSWLTKRRRRFRGLRAALHLEPKLGLPFLGFPLCVCLALSVKQLQGLLLVLGRSPAGGCRLSVAGGRPLLLCCLFSLRTPTISGNAWPGRLRQPRRHHSWLHPACHYRHPAPLFQCRGGSRRSGRLVWRGRTDCCAPTAARRSVSLCGLAIPHSSTARAWAVSSRGQPSLSDAPSTASFYRCYASAA